MKKQIAAFIITLALAAYTLACDNPCWKNKVGNQGTTNQEKVTWIATNQQAAWNKVYAHFGWPSNWRSPQWGQFIKFIDDQCNRGYASGANEIFVKGKFGFADCITPPPPTPTPRPSPTATPRTSPTPTPRPSPTHTPTPTPRPSPTPTATVPPPSPTPTPSATVPPCVYWYGYLKCHDELTCLNSVKAGDRYYSDAQVQIVLNQPVAGSALLYLIQLVINARENILCRSTPDYCIEGTLQAADAVLGDLIPPPWGTDSLPSSQISYLLTPLVKYNQGHLCAQQCGDPPCPSPTPTPNP